MRSSNEDSQLQKWTASTNLQTFSQAEARIAAEIASFGDGFATVFGQYQKATGIEKAVSARAPTFHDLTRECSEQATLFWLRYHIARTFTFLGIYDQASKYQVRETAELIIHHEIYGQLTLAEFLTFLQRFKLGQYGKIYQSARPNPQEFLQCLQPFWNELMRQRGKQAEAEAIERIRTERRKEHITWEEWKRRKEQNNEEVLNGDNPLQLKQENHE